MAFSNIKIVSTVRGHRIYDPVYSDAPVVVKSGIPSRHELPKSKGFSFNMSPPYCDFKILRALCNAGYRQEAENIIRTKRRSYISPDAIMEGLLKYTGSTVPTLNDEVYQQVIREARAQFVIDLDPTSYDEASRNIPQSTSPGLPYINSHRGKKKGKILDYALPRIKQYWDNVGQGKPTRPLPDCAAFARSHIGDYNTNKVSPVLAFPLEVIVAEARYAQPYVESLKLQEIGRNTGYGMEMMKGGMNWLDRQVKRARYKDPGCKFLMTDYSSFDSLVPAWLIRDCFNLIWECYSGHVTSADYHVFKKLASYFINTPIRNSDGRRLRKFHGVPSGSMFTNIINTMVNFIVTRYITKKMCLSDPVFDVYFGDDAVICVNSDAVINIDSLSDAAMYYFGMELNRKKTFWTNNTSNIHFLGYYNSEGDAYKPSSELIASLLYPEYLVDDWRYTLARTMGCLMAAGGNNHDIFLISQMIFLMANDTDVSIFDDAQRLVQNNPRMMRHFINMGVDPSEVNRKMFFNKTYSMPHPSCTKIRLNIEI